MRSPTISPRSLGSTLSASQRFATMRMRNVVVITLLIGSWGATGIAHGQTSSDAAERKVIRRVDPMYPETARRMNLGGTVKLFAVVAPDGTVKTVEAVGGSPLLVQSAQTALMRWKYAPASGESKELVEFHFHPE
jgi:outer membrane biosynthesis protein TonB